MKLIQSLNKLILEQTENASKTETITIPNNVYPNGIFSVAKVPDVAKAIDNVISKIKEYNQKNPNEKINITVESGESAVPNANREVSPPTVLPAGSLAKLRGKSVIDYLNIKLSEALKRGELKEMPIVNLTPTNVESGKQKHKYIKGKDNPKDPKYDEDRYVKITIPLIVRENSEVKNCLANATIFFTYKYNPNGTPCEAEHKCDRAVFNVFLGKHFIDQINLNNEICKKGGSCDRADFAVIKPEVAIAIANDKDVQAANSITLRLECALDKQNDGFYCHTAVPTIGVAAPDRVIMKPFCPLSGLSKEDIESLPAYSPYKEMTIATFDPCITKVIDVFPTLMKSKNKGKEVANNVTN